MVLSPPGSPFARRFPRRFIKPSSPRHASVVIASHNPGFDKWLNEMRVTMRKTRLPWLILSPSLLFLLLFTWFPLGRSVYDSLFDTRMASDGTQYVGLDNFARLFADGVFWQSLVNNLLYILLTVVPGVTPRPAAGGRPEREPSRQPLAAHRLFLPDDYPDGQRRRAVAVYLYARPRPARPLSGKAVRADEQQLAGAQQQRAAGPGADRRVEVRRLLHAVFPRRAAEHSGLDAGSGADGGGYPHAGLF